MKGIVIAAPHSGSGKTTVTLGIMACLKQRGLDVAPFKVGPDFIDPGYHRLITGNPSINLDGWMCGAAFVQETFAHHARSADIAVIEGVMGLFDGIGATSDEGSTAQVAALLGVPVILVVDAKGQARSVAALVKGFADFDRRIDVAGVIFNNVASDSHARILREAVQAGCPGVKVVGALRRNDSLAIPSRHLGLVTADDNPLSPYYVHQLARVVGEQVDIDAVVELAAMPAPPPLRKGGGGGFHPEGNIPLDPPFIKGEEKPRIAIARDAAFCFVYDDNLRLLELAGAELVEFSPLNDQELPDAIDGLYLPGGYPELYAEQLANNFGMKSAIRKVVEAGMPVYAECGGFIYLTRGVNEIDVSAPRRKVGGAKLRHFVGIFPVTTTMLPRRKALGYREIETVADSLLGPAGIVARGHEFHYSEMEEMPPEVERVYRVRRQGLELGMEGFRFRNCIASYVHLHFGSCLEIAAHFIQSCRNYRKD